jgi:hypothetical protein
VHRQPAVLIGLYLLLLLDDWLSFINRGRGDCRALLFRQLEKSLRRIDQSGPLRSKREGMRNI